MTVEYCPVCKAKKDFRRYQHGSWFVFKCETCQLDLQERDALLQWLTEWDWRRDSDDENNTLDSIIGDMR